MQIRSQSTSPVSTRSVFSISSRARVFQPSKNRPQVTIPTSIAENDGGGIMKSKFLIFDLFQTFWPFKFCIFFYFFNFRSFSNFWDSDFFQISEILTFFKFVKLLRTIDEASPMEEDSNTQVRKNYSSNTCSITWQLSNDCFLLPSFSLLFSLLILFSILDQNRHWCCWCRNCTEEQREVSFDFKILEVFRLKFLKFSFRSPEKDEEDFFWVHKHTREFTKTQTQRY